MSVCVCVCVCVRASSCAKVAAAFRAGTAKMKEHSQKKTWGFLLRALLLCVYVFV